MSTEKQTTHVLPCTTSSFPFIVRKGRSHLHNKSNNYKFKAKAKPLLGTISSISSDMAVPSRLDAKQRYFPWKLLMIPRFWITKVPELLDATILGSDDKSNGFPSLVQLKLKNKINVTVGRHQDSILVLTRGKWVFYGNKRKNWM